MNILKLNKLNIGQITDITELAELCDQYNPYYEESSATGEVCFFLYYEGSKLISFLSFLAAPKGNSCDSSDASNTTLESEAEITAMTHPSNRRQGLFTQLFMCSIVELNILNISDIYCAIPSEYQNTRMCKGLSHSEFLLKLTVDSVVQPSNVLNALPQKLNHLQFTSSTCKESEIPTAYNLIQKRFLHRFKFIGLCHLSEELEFTNLWGFEIKKPYRNQGYGLQLMNHVINDYFKCSTKPLILNVTSTNTYACKLYNYCGFKTLEQIHYYKLL